MMELGVFSLACTRMGMTYAGLSVERLEASGDAFLFPSLMKR